MSETEVSVPKKRGRPSLKALEPANMNSSISDNEVSVIVSPKRGRPAKSAVESNDEVSVKRGRGRPPKNGSAVKKAAVPARSVGRPVKQTNVKASGENKVRIRINKTNCTVLYKVYLRNWYPRAASIRL